MFRYEMHYYHQQSWFTIRRNHSHTYEYSMIRQNFQLQAIRKSLCLPFMFPEWQCRHIRGSLDSSLLLLLLLLLGKQPILQSNARTWKIPLYSWLPLSSSIHRASIASRLAFIDHPTKNLVQTCRDSIAFRLRKHAPSTCANDRSRSRADSGLCSNPRSFVEAKMKNLLLLEIPLLISIHPICPLSASFYFHRMKLLLLFVFLSRKFHPWTYKTTSSLSEEQLNNAISILYESRLFTWRVSNNTFVRITAFLFPIFPRDNAIPNTETDGGGSCERKRETGGYRDREELLSDKLAAVVIDAAPLPVVGRLGDWYTWSKTNTTGRATFAA